MSPTLLWLIAGAIFIAVEMFGMPGLGFLFIGIGALVVGGSIELGVIASDAHLIQFVLFALISVISAVLLWNKLKAKTDPHAAYSNMVGTEAIVGKDGLVGNKEGEVKWSGTIMRAQLISNDGLSAVAEGTAVIIERVEGNVLFVSPKK